MRSALLYLMGAVFLALIVSVAWWTREFRAPVGPAVHEVQPGETPLGIAEAYGITLESLAQANRATEGVFEPTPGEAILVPARELTWQDTVIVHAVGVLAEVVGVFMSFWLGIVSGILPKDLRRQILGIALVLGLASYAATHAIGQGSTELTPQLVFASIKDGFAWSAAFPLFARAFGLRDRPQAE